MIGLPRAVGSSGVTSYYLCWGDSSRTFPRDEQQGALCALAHPPPLSFILGEGSSAMAGSTLLQGSMVEETCDRIAGTNLSGTGERYGNTREREQK